MLPEKPLVAALRLRVQAPVEASLSANILLESISFESLQVRANGEEKYGTQFLKIATHPCPCGFYGDASRECRCSPGQVERYRQKISGPLLDRIDLHVEVPLVEYKQLSSDEVGETSATVRQRVMECRSLQADRFAKDSHTRVNSDMGPKIMRTHCSLDTDCSNLLEQAMSQLNFSARAHDRILKVARTIADLAGVEKLSAEHVLEAIQYRSLDRKLSL